MKQNDIPAGMMKQILRDQQNEIDAGIICSRTAALIRDMHSAEILRQIARDEFGHCNQLKKITGRELKTGKMKVLFFLFIVLIFGLTFGLKLLEREEDKAVNIEYRGLEQYVPGLGEIVEQEERHESQLLGMISEERLSYLGPVVLGLNDALVELTGTLAGLSFTFQNTRIIALSGLITGIAASFPMAASEYLSSKADGEAAPFKSSLYTGNAYIVTVIMLLLTYLIFTHYLLLPGRYHHHIGSDHLHLHLHLQLLHIGCKGLPIFPPIHRDGRHQSRRSRALFRHRGGGALRSRHRYLIRIPSAGLPAAAEVPVSEPPFQLCGAAGELARRLLRFY